LERDLREAKEAIIRSFGGENSFCCVVCTENLMLKRASASRPSGEWGEDDYDVLADRCAPRGMMTPCIFFAARFVINFAQTRLGTLRYIFAITDSGPESGAGGRETGRAPA
jgi:hypothetical protein